MPRSQPTSPARHGVVLFGELLLRLNAEGFSRLVQAERFQAGYTGAEANAGVALAGWGWDAAMVSRVPAHEIGQACVNFLRRYGVDMTHVQRGGDRLGILYVETGASQRPSQVIYDRAGSAFLGFDDAAVDWDAVFRGRRWFHFSGTAPAVAPRLVAAIERACIAARRRGVTVSCDLNFRRTLWTLADARRTMARLMANVDVLIGNGQDAFEVLGPAKAGGELDPARYGDLAVRLRKKYGFAQVALTQRESLSASRNRWAAWLAAGGRVHRSRRYEIEMVDRVGAGDAFAGGVIHGMAAGWAAGRVVEFAAAASCLKHTIPGDFDLVSLAEIEALVRGDGSGRIRR